MWPDDRDQPVEVEAAFGADLTADPGVWAWTDLSSRLLADPIRLRGGRSSGAGQVSPSTGSVLLDNDDGALTPLHPMSTYWPNVRRGTPVRFRLRRVEDAFGRTSPTPLNANPYFETNVSGWSGLGGTVVRSTAQAHEGVASLLLTPDGVTATVEARSENAAGVVAGQTYRVSAWVRCAVARSVNANIVWRDASGTFLSSAGAVSIAVAATTWALIEVSGTAPALAAQGQISVSMGSTPPASNTLRIDEAIIAPASDGGWGTADSGQAWSAYGAGGSVLASDQTVSGGLARQSVPTTSAYRSSWLPDLSLLNCTVRLSGLSLPFTDVTGGSVEPGNILLRAQSLTTYYLARVEITTAEAVLCKLYNPAGTQLASATVSGLTHTTAQTLEVVAEIVGDQFRMKVWATSGAEPAGWSVAATDGTLALPGGIGVRTGVAAGNTNAKPVVASYGSITVRVDRFNGFADQWEPTYLPTTSGKASSSVRVTASGLLRRLDQGTKPARSAPARYIPTTNPVAYWPLEDGQLVSEGAALVGGQTMRPFTGTHPSGAVVTFAQWGRGELAPWLPDAVSRSGNRGLAIIWAPVSMPATTRWAVDFIYRSGTDAGDSTVDINPSYLPGGGLGWPQLTLNPEFRGTAVSMNGEPEVTATAATLFDGQPHHVRWEVSQNGSLVSWYLYVDAVVVTAGSTTGSMTLPVVRTVALAAGAQAGADMAQGHLAVWTSPPPVVDAVAAAKGNAGELAAARVARLCAEEGIAVSVGGGASEPLGPQPVAGLMDLLREAEEADMGVLFEQGYGLGYRPHGDRYNTAVAMTVDLAAYRVARGGSGDVLVPAYDDQDLRNEWTVDRVNGGTSGPVADIAHQLQAGVYSDSVQLNLATDDRLVDHASWRVHLGTVEALRERSFPLDLAANPELIDGWLSCGVGSRMVRTNPPTTYPPGDLDRLVEGWSESIGPRSWLVQVTPSPASPWDVATVSGAQRVAAVGATLNAGITATATTLSIASPAGALWTTKASAFPLDVLIGGGERVTLPTPITGAASPQSAAGVVRAVNGVARAWPAGTSIQVWAPAVVAL